jgi:WhiB family transcriptional regulator, redox-sensing transcriptional regulator
VTGRWNWRVAARCRTIDADGLFVTGARQREARQFCRTCPVRTECLAHALDQRIEFGVWGGMTERERRALLRARPEVGSWAELLADARTAHYSSAAAAETADALAMAAEPEAAQLEESA